MMGFGVNIPRPALSERRLLGSLRYSPTACLGALSLLSRHSICEAEIQAKIALLGRLGWCLERVRPLVDTSGEGAYSRTDPADLACDFPQPGTCPRLHRTDSAHPGPSHVHHHPPTCPPHLSPTSLHPADQPYIVQTFLRHWYIRCSLKPLDLRLCPSRNIQFVASPPGRHLSAFTHSSAST